MIAAVLKPPAGCSVQTLETPVPGDGEVLLKVDACALCGTDKRVLAGEKPVSVPIIGHEIAGTVVSLGSGVKEGRTADGSAGPRLGGRYAVQTVVGCGRCAPCRQDRQNLCEAGFTAIGYAYNGGFAEYMVMPRNAVEQGCLIPIPDTLDADRATLLEPLSCGINGLRGIPLEGMDHVVVVGAGVIGVLNGLIARARGAKRVTLMNRSGTRLDLAKKLGLPFDDFLDMSKTDPAAWVAEQTRGKGVDAVILSASVKTLASRALSWLARDGHMSLFAGMPKSDCVEPLDLNLIHYRELHLHGANSSVRRDYLEALEFLESGRIDGGALVTHRFPLQAFQEAIAAQADSRSGALKIIIRP